MKYACLTLVLYVKLIAFTSSFIYPTILPYDTYVDYFVIHRKESLCVKSSVQYKSCTCTHAFMLALDTIGSEIFLIVDLFDVLFTSQHDFSSPHSLLLGYVGIPDAVFASAKVIWFAIFILYTHNELTNNRRMVCAIVCIYFVWIVTGGWWRFSSHRGLSQSDYSCFIMFESAAHGMHIEHDGMRSKWGEQVSHLSFGSLSKIFCAHISRSSKLNNTYFWKLFLIAASGFFSLLSLSLPLYNTNLFFLHLFLFLLHFSFLYTVFCWFFHRFYCSNT